MPEIAYRDTYETSTHRGTYDILIGLDNNFRDLANEMYMFRRETQRDLSELKQEVATLKASDAKHDKNIDRLQDDVSELKQEAKDLRRDISDIKGDIKALAAGFGAAQNRFNWGLVILGIFIALIQLLK
ncbi:MAG: hypothetical protein IJS39_02120 [Synergistaceae bacterium]|nr:hypothetical protein [Synergistaceae bacterium]